MHLKEVVIHNVAHSQTVWLKIIALQRSRYLNHSVKTPGVGNYRRRRPTSSKPRVFDAKSPRLSSASGCLSP